MYVYSIIIRMIYSTISPVVLLALKFNKTKKKMKTFLAISLVMCVETYSNSIIMTFIRYLVSHPSIDLHSPFIIFKAFNQFLLQSLLNDLLILFYFPLLDNFINCFILDKYRTYIQFALTGALRIRNVSTSCVLIIFRL